MRSLGAGRQALLGLGLLASAALVGCSTNSAHSAAAPTSGQVVTSPSAAPASSVPIASAVPANAGGIANLVVTSATRSQLLATYAAGKGISVSDVAGTVPGSVYYSFDPARDTYWALASFEPSHTAPLTVQIGFQDGAELGMFTKVGPGNWRVKIGHEPDICGEISYFPRPVLTVWSLPVTTTGVVC